MLSHAKGIWNHSWKEFACETIHNEKFIFMWIWQGYPCMKTTFPKWKSIDFSQHKMLLFGMYILAVWMSRSHSRAKSCYFSSVFVAYMTKSNLAWREVWVELCCDSAFEDRFGVSFWKKRNLLWSGWWCFCSVYSNLGSDLLCAAWIRNATQIEVPNSLKGHESILGRTLTKLKSPRRY